MPPKTKKDNEYLIKRRLAQKICKRRRYAEIKNDPELLELEKKKRKERYLKQKEANKENKKSTRALKEQRKKWRENSKRYRQKKKEEAVEGRRAPFQVINIQAVNDENSSDSSDTKGLDPLQHSSEFKAAVRKIRYIELKKRKQLLRIIAAQKKRDLRQRKRIQRLMEQLKEAQIMRTDHASTSADKSQDTESKSGVTEKIKTTFIERIKSFYTEDANSTISACKKEYITRNKERKQKRYLCLPLKDLYKKFLLETNMKVSYSFFCKLRPFWVLFPRNANRETCQCTVHTNMELLISALNRASVLNEKNSDQVLSKLCCDTGNINCLQRTCDACRANSLDYNHQVENSSVTYFQWNKVTKDVILEKGGKKKQTVTEKSKITTTSTEAIAKMERDLKIFLQHTYKVIGQYKAIKGLKENLNIYEALVHVDFSENYSLKFAEEVQSFHFGGSRKQVSLHTAVIYTHNFDTGLVTPTSMCTLSDCLRHDAAAIWAHLVPLIEEVLKLNGFIDTIHFLSDSPSSQYRNKNMFYIITQIHKDFPVLHKVTWNYSESGHGKGAPDGIGATLKRTADRMVLHGQDIGTFNQFYDLIKGRIENEQLNIIVKIVDEKDILLKTNLLPDNLNSFKGTLSVHQVIWESFEKTIILRSMSCFECSASVTCVHGRHLGVFVPGPVRNASKPSYSKDLV